VSAGAPHVEARYLVARSGGKRLALPLAEVIEVMRPLPISRLEGAPPFVLGASVVRGGPVPVLDAAALVGEEPGTRAASRFVSLRVGTRRAVLAVEAVVGVHALDPRELTPVPPLLRGVAAGVADAIGSLDRELLLVLGAARLVPPGLWSAVAAGGGT
jgi:purine-binding chemotaxis protein CheW